MAIFGALNWTTGENPLVNFIKGTGDMIAGDIGNPVGLILIIMVAFITFAGARIFSFDKSFAAASFIGFILSGLLVSAGLLTSPIMYLNLGLLILAIFLMIINK